MVRRRDHNEEEGGPETPEQASAHFLLFLGVRAGANSVTPQSRSFCLSSTFPAERGVGKTPQTPLAEWSLPPGPAINPPLYQKWRTNRVLLPYLRVFGPQ